MNSLRPHSIWDWQKYRRFIYDLRSCNINSGFIGIQGLLILLNSLQLLKYHNNIRSLW